MLVENYKNQSHDYYQKEVEEVQSALIQRGDENAEESIAAKLRELGFSSFAARALVSLLGNSPQSAGSICKATGIPDSKIYYALEELDRAKLVESQRGVPTLYKPVNLDQMVSDLKHAQDEEHQQRLRFIELFKKQAEPLVKAHSEPTEVELAYIVKGRRNIVERMLTAMEQARKELVLLIKSEEIWNGIALGLLKAKRRKVKIGIAVTANLSGAETLRSFVDVRRLKCDCDILIADSEKLVTASEVDSDDAYAIVTSDKAMIRMSREYFHNPNCCARP
jgi:sugar-specific transcriptional regulator TrmB